MCREIRKTGTIFLCRISMQSARFRALKHIIPSSEIKKNGFEDAVSPPEGIETRQDLYKSLQVSKKLQPFRMAHGNDLYGGKKAIPNPSPARHTPGLFFCPHRAHQMQHFGSPKQGCQINPPLPAETKKHRRFTPIYRAVDQRCF